MADQRTRVRIDRLDEHGEGRGNDNGRRFAVAGAVPGDVAEVELTRAPRPGASLHHGILHRLLTPSPDRIEPPCRHFGTCGGCAVQQLSDTAYLDWKTGRILDALADEHVAFAPGRLQPWVRTAPGSRRRVDLTFRLEGGTCRLGLNQRASHSITEIVECHVLLPELVRLLDPLRAVLRELLPAGLAGEVVINRLDAGCDVLIAPEKAAMLSMERRSRLAAFATEHDLVRVSWGARSDPEIVVRRLAPRLASLELPLEVPPGAFLQASLAGEQAMQTLLKRWAAPARRVVDLYGGIGTLSLPLLRSSRVRIVEGDAAAVTAVESALRQAGLQGRGEIERRDLARDPLQAAELDRFDLAILDPPRAGARAQARELAQSGLHRIVAVSCNPRSFAHDVKILTDAGFEIMELVPIDQFLWSAHIELIAHLERPRRSRPRR